MTKAGNDLVDYPNKALVCSTSIDYLVSLTRALIGSAVVVSSLEDLAETAFSSKNKDSRSWGKGSSKTSHVGQVVTFLPTT